MKLSPLASYVSTSHGREIQIVHNIRRTVKSPRLDQIEKRTSPYVFWKKGVKYA